MARELQRVCVFCASSPGVSASIRAAAADVGRTLARAGITLVYGGGSTGLMGIVANAALDAGGEVVGVIPRALASKEIAHQGLTQMHCVTSMHERKALMADISDGFIALPGGFGTMEEILEIVTWAQLGIHLKPCAILNIAGYYDHLLAFLTDAEAGGFLDPMHHRLLLLESDVETLLARMRAYQSPVTRRWARDEQR